MELPGAVYFVIGPEQQFAAYEQYLRAAVDPAAKLHRLHPRDFWLTEEGANLVDRVGRAAWAGDVVDGAYDIPGAVAAAPGPAQSRVTT